MMARIVPANVLRALIGQSKKRCVAYADMIDKLDQGMGDLRFEAEKLAQENAPDPGTASAAREHFEAIQKAFAQSRQHLEAQAHYELRLQGVLGTWLAAMSPRGPEAGAFDPRRAAPGPQRTLEHAPQHAPEAGPVPRAAAQRMPPPWAPYVARPRPAPASAPRQNGRPGAPTQAAEQASPDPEQHDDGAPT